MSGHSKWAKIRRSKAVTDAKRGKMFTQLIKEITIASRLGGGDPDGNPRLRLAIDKAKSGNMPADNVKRAIQKGTGELPGMVYEDATYEAYGPGGVALLIEAVTDNKTRTVNEIRHVLDRNHGKLAASGSVAYQFHRKGQISVLRDKIGEDDLMGIILDAGADDMASEEDHYLVTTTPDVLEKVKKAIEARKIPIDHSEIQMIPENTVKIEGKEAESLVNLIEGLEDHDDITHVYGNFDIDERTLEQLNAD